jgi:hypothetical protein
MQVAAVQESGFDKLLEYDPIEEEIQNEIKEKENEQLRQKLLLFAN